MLGDPPSPGPVRRYWKFAWADLAALPVVGAVDYAPKNRGAFRMFAEGKFIGEHLEAFSAVKTRKNLPGFGNCVYCGRGHDGDGNALKLTGEHVIPEFLGAGLELREASCFDCQKATSKFEVSVAQEMLDPVRKAFALVGKEGVLKKSNFPLDIGRETTEHEYIPLVHYPTILVMPVLYPASTYSRRPVNADGPFNFRLYNINADAALLQRYSLDAFSSQAIDMVRFAQLIAKIAHVYAMHHFRSSVFVPRVAEFVRTDFPREAAPPPHYLEHVGCLWRQLDGTTGNLHEIEVGRMTWNGSARRAVRVRLFASYGMPSYYVTVE
ncbi:hypothetical protein [Ochrobactrum sp. A-1]|uniref:hypothetical protein n=1 Tax=Ochrobactrum sp. A-1 TaxID=2920940 RepID=UPI001F0B2BBF|nr:hypothetical protein [Ochrobactrum sp. A-1]